MKKTTLKIAQVIASKGWGGREKVPLLFGEEYRRLGHRPTFWVDPGTRMGQEALRLGFTVRPFRFRARLNPMNFRDVRQALQKDRPDVIHVHHSRDLGAVVPVLRFMGWGGPLLLSKHIESSVGKKDPFHRFLYDRVDLVLGCSTMIQKNVLATCPVDAGRVAVGYAPVDTDRFRYRPVPRRNLRRSWGIGKTPVIGMVSRLSPGKGHELLLRAAAFLIRKDPRLKFKIAGQASTDEEDYARKLIGLRDHLELKGKFDYVGYQKDIPSFLSALDLAVHTAPKESFGLAIVEAMACGLPVVVRRGGGVEDILVPSKGRTQGGVLLDSKDPREWADGIARALRSKGDAGRRRRENRKRALRFSLKTLALWHLDRYREQMFQKSGIPVKKGTA